MARLESVAFEPQHARVHGRRLIWTPATASDRFESLPQIFWTDGQPWLEANLWLYERATNGVTTLRTVQTNATALVHYAKWLEATHIKWTDFPQRRAHRCLVRFRGALVKARDSGQLAPSTVTARMRTALAFYRWAAATGLLSPTWPMWIQRVVGVRVLDSCGIERSISVTTTDLSIPCRRAPGERLEDVHACN
ncbi:MAG: hypothetical protein ACTHNO_04260 [Ralstonia sp.]|uniref:hypothetical protein n=1 Tax=Ralstonia sp. TaxID=54061 RepID=UPI003F80C224